MVEVKARKSAFLREATSSLGAGDTAVETSRFEELLARPELHEAFDVLSFGPSELEARRPEHASGVRSSRVARSFCFGVRAAQRCLIWSRHFDWTGHSPGGATAEPVDDSDRSPADVPRGTLMLLYLKAAVLPLGGSHRFPPVDRMWGT